MSRTSQTIINSFEILGTVALHFLWQGTLAGIIYYLLRFIVRRASTRAGLALAAIVLMLVLPILTIWYIEKPLGEMSSMAVWKISIGVIWIIGASCLLSRFIPGFLKLNRLRQPGNYIEDEVAGQFEQLKTKFHFRRNITLLLHEAIKVPITFGFWKPVIIMPMSALSGLPGDQIELVLAHELSHIRRNDYLWNLVQTLAESCLFFHPAVWLISKDLRKEREYACDDYVVRLYEDRTTYANALANMESQRQTNLAMAANGSEFSLLGRIRRILDEDSDPGSDRRRLTGELMSVILNASIKVRGPVSKE
ncbi:MAG: M56 family metallopeptidase, partial [Verrucomicrobiales bacterium]|nr:M56 family metallopeptidase [Verrucomicrobiales bacterium]